MSSKVRLPPPEFSDMSYEDWEYMTAGPDKVPVPEWHLELLREREARYERDGMEGITWEELEKELLEELTKGAT